MFPDSISLESNFIVTSNITSPGPLPNLGTVPMANPVPTAESAGHESSEVQLQTPRSRTSTTEILPTEPDYHSSESDLEAGLQY